MFGNKGFQKPQVFLNLFISNAGLIVIATGMTMVIISGGIDISVGSFVALTCMVLAWMMEKGNMNAVSSIIVIMLMGLVFGLVQGILIAYLNIQPFIVTLAGMFFARGMTAIISQEMISIKNETFLAWANNKITIPLFGIVNKKGVTVYPYIYPTVIAALIILVIMFILLKYTKFGRSVYAVGGNEQSALLLGLNVKSIKLKVYILNGLLCSIGGFLFCLNTCAGFVEQAKGFEMEAIAVGLEETLDEDMISQGPIFIEFMVNELVKRGIPVVTPAGGLGCHINAMKFLEHLPQTEYPAGALAAALFIVSGSRGMERGTISEQRDENGVEPLANMELLRLALPRRVFTVSHIMFIVDRLEWLFKNRELVGGLEWSEEPNILRFFFGKLRAKGDWPEKLLEKFEQDFADSL